MRIALMFLLLSSALNAQGVTVPGMEAGDVLFIDTATEKPYLWFHVKTGKLDSLPGFTPEQVYRLLLEREQNCWSIHMDLTKHVSETISVKLPPLLPLVTR